MVLEDIRQVLIVDFNEAAEYRLKGQPPPRLVHLLGALGPLQGVLILAPDRAKAASVEPVSRWFERRFGFCVVAARWPGRELVEILQGRWCEAFLQSMLALPLDAQGDGPLVAEVRRRVQRWFADMKLTPPLLLDHLDAECPPLPVKAETNLKPGADIQPWLAQSVWQWQVDWPVRTAPTVQSILSALTAAWPQQAEPWLVRQLAGDKGGSVVLAQCYLAAVSELLHTFIAGVAHKLEDVEDDLADLEQRLRQITRFLADEPAATSLELKRKFVRLTYLRLRTLQTGWHLEAILPFYRRLLADWQQVVERWQQTCRQVGHAAVDPRVTAWTARLTSLLSVQLGAWQEALVETLYQEAVQQQPRLTWRWGDPLAGWAIEGLGAEGIIRRLGDYADPILSPFLDIPLEQALRRQLPQTQAQAAWLTALVTQARSSHYLDNVTGAGEPLQTWLLLPAGEHSPLASLAQTLPDSPIVWPSSGPDLLAVVMLRRQSV